MTGLVSFLLDSFALTFDSQCCETHLDVSLQALMLNAVWEVWEKEAEKNRQVGVQAELEKRKAAALAAEQRKLEIKSSLA